MKAYADAPVFCALFGSLLRKEKGGSQSDLFNGTKREESDRRHPRLFRDTLLLVVALLIPFLLCVVSPWN